MVKELEWCTISLSSTLDSDTDQVCRVVVVGLHIHIYIITISIIISIPNICNKNMPHITTSMKYINI